MDFTSIHNFYEHLVIDYLQAEVIPSHEDQSTDFFLDVACYALSKLPSRYMRHEIDMAFYLESKERAEMMAEVKKHVDEAVQYITQNFNKNERYEP
ncbi:MAG: competence protein ComFB [endosymbiont of Galathealinum brachiosum]|uniref:Competence protein ComFB n=1 Tax=endosymbiont of Galathealinum brachiosum TaxID=2200906 RepID=A0A370D8U0_9GAMM|nr:MAG: competence protein ComFB [endosymbiont of Galathealinum brachiosum]